MILLAGLGNPGARYQFTRHNFGFLALERLAEKLGIGPSDWAEKNKSRYAQTRRGGESLLLVEPQTFMNLSGEALTLWVQFYKIPIGAVIVLVDDYDLPFGRIRLRAGGSDGGHNGLKSLNQYVGNSFPRVRLGMRRETMQAPMADWVLQNFAPDERADLPKVLDAASDAVLEILDRGVEKAMNRWNGKEILVKP